MDEGTCAFAVRDALHALAVTLWPTADVRYGRDSIGDATELVRLLDFRTVESYRTSGGTSALKNDAHDHRLSIIGFTGDDDQHATEVKVRGMYRDLQTALRADPILGGAVSRPGWAEISAVALDDTTDDESIAGRFSELVVTVHVEATI